MQTTVEIGLEYTLMHGKDSTPETTKKITQVLGQETISQVGKEFIL